MFILLQRKYVWGAALVVERKHVEMLTKNLAQPLAKAIAHLYFGEIGAKIAEGAVGIISQKISGYYEQRELGRKLDSLAEKVVESLVPIFEENPASTTAIEPISLQLAPVVTLIASSEYLLAKNLDPRVILHEINTQLPLPRAQFGDLETQLYERALDRLVRCLIEISPTLPRFAAESTARSLQQLAAFVDTFDKVAKRIERIEDTTNYFLRYFKDESEAHKKFEIDYRLAVARQVDYLELFGADISPESRRHELSVA